MVPKNGAYHAQLASPRHLLEDRQACLGVRNLGEKELMSHFPHHIASTL